MNAVGSDLLPGPAGNIEVMWKLPPEGDFAEPLATALVCHPHPLYGGNMHNKVVHRSATALAACGVATLRFNFRGVGLSAGRHDQGRGEADDARFLLDRLRERWPALPLLVAGYSFGAWVALRAGALDTGVRGLIGIGLATRFHDFDAVLATPAPLLLVQGGADALGPRSEIEALAARFLTPPTLVVVDGADHFLGGGLDAVAAAIGSFVRDRLQLRAAVSRP